MRKTIIAYLLTCIEELTDDKELGLEILSLEDVIFAELEKNSDPLLNILFIYIIITEHGYFDEERLGFETRNLYNEIKYFFDEYTPST